MIMAAFIRNTLLVRRHGAAVLDFLVRARRWMRCNRRLPTRQELHRGMHQIKNMIRISGRYANVPPGFSLPQKLEPYQAWLAVNRFAEEDANHLRAKLEAVGAPLPRISVIMPVYNPNPIFLDEAIRSVINQIYGNWELCITDDASTDDDVRATILRWQKADARVRVIRRETNGNISIAMNDAAESATGEFLAFLDHDDVLTPDALGEVALALSANPAADLLYSDDDKIDQHGNRFAPQFKPDWSPELLLSYMYWSHVVVVRRSLFELLGGMRVGFEGSQDYDFVLRASEWARQVVHLPYILYHWRVVPGSTAMSGHAKPESFEAGRRAVQEALVRRGIKVAVVQPDWALREGLGIYRPVFPDDGPSITIVIPTKNGWKLLDRCLQSLKQTSYSNFTVLVVDNGSDDEDSLRYLASLQYEIVRVLNPSFSFNFAYVNNRAVDQVQSEYVLFLNNDTEVLSPDWLSVMAGYAQLEGVGAVGARLLYPDRRVQHAGVVHGLYDGLAGPAFKLLPSWDHGYLARACVTQNTAAVTAACMLTPKELFSKLGGFDEANFAVAYNDVDYCYRLTDSGYRSVVAGEIELIHYEGQSRGFNDDPGEIARFRRKYGQKVDHYYNPNLSLDDERFVVRRVRIVRSPVETPVKVFLCAHNLNWEGAPYSQLEMTIALKERGIIDPVVFSLHDGPLRAEYEHRGISVVCGHAGFDEVLTLGQYETALSEFGERINQHQTEVVYANTLRSFYAIDAADRLRVASMWNVRESEPWQRYFSYLDNEVAARALSCYAKPYRVIFVADATRRECEVLNTVNNFEVIHNGVNLTRLKEACAGVCRVDARSSLGIREEEIAILLVGTVCERKGQKDLVLAVDRLHRNGCSGFRVFVVGDRASMYSQELHKLVRTLPDDVRHKVRIIPETNDIAAYWMAADIFVCTSRVESYPRVTLEAMAFGLPIVTTGVYGILEQVRQGRNAFIYEPGDSAALATCLEKLIVQRNLREAFGMASKEVLACLTSFDDMVEAYGRVFLEARQVRAV